MSEFMDIKPVAKERAPTPHRDELFAFVKHSFVKFASGLTVLKVILRPVTKEAKELSLLDKAAGNVSFVLRSVSNRLISLARLVFNKGLFQLRVSKQKFVQGDRAARVRRGSLALAALLILSLAFDAIVLNQNQYVSAASDTATGLYATDDFDPGGSENNWASPGGTATDGGSCVTNSEHCNYIDDNDTGSSTYVGTGTGMNSTTAVEEYEMEDISYSGTFDQITAVTAYIDSEIVACSGNGDNCDDLNVRLFTGGSYDSSTKTITSITTTSAEYSVTWAGLTSTSATDARIEITRVVIGGGSPNGRDDNIRISEVRIDATYDYSTAPVFPQLTIEGYTFENDDAADNDDSTTVAGTNFTTGKTLSNVRRGETINLRTHITNSGDGAVEIADELALFYDRNDGIWSKVQNQEPLETPAGSGCGGSGSSDWTCSVVDNDTDNTGQYVSHAYTADGRPAVSYYDATATALMYAEYVGSNGTGCGSSGSSEWNCTVVDNDTNDTGTNSSLAFDAAGTAYIAYEDDLSVVSNVMVAQYVGSGGSGCGASGSSAWTCITVDSDKDNPHIAINSSGTIYISYTNKDGAPQTDALLVAEYVGSGGSNCDVATWDCSWVDVPVGNSGRDSSVAFFWDGTPLISFSKLASGNSLEVAQYVGSDGSGCEGVTDWTCTQIQSEGGTTQFGPYTSLAIDPSGAPAISSHDNTNGSLMFAEYVVSGGSGCGSSGSSAWNCTIVDNTSADTGEYTNLVYSPDGVPFITYYDATGTALMVAQYVGSSGSDCTSSAWTCTVIDDDTDNTGQHASLAFSQTGTPTIGYYDLTTTSLMVAEIVRAGEILIAPSSSSSSGEVLNESHVDMTSSTDTTNRDDADCISGGAAWNNGVVFGAENGTGLSLAAGDITEQCTEIIWSIDTSQATTGETYRFIVASKDSFRPDKNPWRGPIAVGNNGYAQLTIASSDLSTYRYSKDALFSKANTQGLTEGANATGAGTNVECQSGTNYVWTNDTNVTTSDNNYATNNVPLKAEPPVDKSECLETTNYSFSIPTEATIKGVEIVVEGYEGSTNPSNSANLLKGGVGAGSSKQVPFTTSDASHILGGSTDLWDTTLTPSDVNASNFGVYFQSLSGAFTYGDTFIDHVTIKVYYDFDYDCTDTAWTCTVIDDQTNSIDVYISMALDPSGTPWVSYPNDIDGSLVIAKYVGSNGNCDTYASGSAGSDAWQCTVVDDQTDDVGFDPSLAFDASGNAWVSYENYDTGSIIVAKYVGSDGNCDTYAAGSAGSDAWQCTAVDAQTDVGLFNSSLAFDASGNAWVSYANYTNPSLIVAKYVGSDGNCDTYAAGSAGSDAWECTVVDDQTDLVNGETSLAFSSSGAPWVSYFNNTDDSSIIAKLKIPESPPTRAVVNAYNGRNAGTSTLRYSLSSGLAPYTDSYGTCGGLATLLGYCGLYSADGQLDSITVQADQRAVYQASTRYDNNSELPFAKVAFQTDASPATQNVKLQVYRYGTTNAWEDVATYSTAGCSTSNCVISGNAINTSSEYYETDGSDYWVHYRVYQEEGGTSFTLRLDSFTAHPPRSLLRASRVFREGVSNPLE